MNIMIRSKKWTFPLTTFNKVWNKVDPAVSPLKIYSRETWFEFWFMGKRMVPARLLSKMVSHSTLRTNEIYMVYIIYIIKYIVVLSFSELTIGKQIRFNIADTTKKPKRSNFDCRSDHIKRVFHSSAEWSGIPSNQVKRFRHLKKRKSEYD